MKLKDFERDHIDLFTQVEELQALIRSGVQEHAKEISQMLTRVSINVRLHLAAEDHDFYPALAKSGDAEAAALGERYQKEMGGLYDAFAEYIKEWRDPERIRAQTEEFKQRTDALFAALAERIQREDEELYKIAKELPASDK